jgi:glycosyltransferase involved in cell wall biosynthesis
MKTILICIDSLQNGGGEKGLINLLNLIDFNKYKIDLQLLSDKIFFKKMIPAEVNQLPLPNYFRTLNLSYFGLFKSRYFNYILTRALFSISLRWRKKNIHVLQIYWKYIAKYLENNPTEYDIAIAFSQGLPTYYVNEKIIANKKIARINCTYSNTRYNKSMDHTHYINYKIILLTSESTREDFSRVFPDLSDRAVAWHEVILDDLVRKQASEGPSFNDDFKGFRILTNGRLEWVKGIDLAIDACKMIIEDGYNIRWYVLGMGSLKSELEKKILANELQNNFILLGEHINPFPYVNRCQIYVQPSRVEGWPMALAEAKILCKPVVTTNFLSAKEQILHGYNGLISEISSKSIYENVKFLLENQNEMEKFSNILKLEDQSSCDHMNSFYRLLEG